MTTEASQPRDSVLPAAPAPADAALRQRAEASHRDAAVHVGAASPPLVRPVAGASPALPTNLKRQTVTAQKGETRFSLEVLYVNGYWMETYTAYDYIAMYRAAAREGLRLDLTSAYRSPQAQAEIYKARYNPDGSYTAEGRRLGPAAKPGRSSHQQGISLDIWTGIPDKAAFDAGVRTAEYHWLLANAARFGFSNHEEPSVPWHWTHKERRFVAQTEAEAAGQDYAHFAGYLIDPGPATLAVFEGSGGLVQLLKLARKDRSQAYFRASLMLRSSRSDYMADQTRSSLHQGAAVTNYNGQTQTAENQAQAAPQAGMNADSLKGVLFDFSTGLWTDGRPV